MYRDRPEPCPTSWGCAAFASKWTTSRRLSTGWLWTATAWSATSVNTRTSGGWPTCAGRRESSWPWPSESTDTALGRSRRRPAASSELGWAIDEFQGDLRRSGPYRPDGLETRLDRHAKGAGGVARSPPSCPQSVDLLAPPAQASRTHDPPCQPT